MYVAPYLEKWPQAMYIGLDPSNVQKTVLQIHSISDEIWHIAGDKSVDVISFNLISLVYMVYEEGTSVGPLHFN